MKRKTARLAVLALSLSMLPQLAGAAVLIHFRHASPGGAEPTAAKAWVESDRFRMETGDQVVIFRGDKQLLWMVDAKNGRYFEMTAEQLRKTGEMMSGMMAQMQEQLKALPPEQRAMAEKMMAGKMPGMAEPAAEPKIESTGKRETINGFPCTEYRVARDGAVKQELWVTDWNNLGLEASDFKVFEDMAAFVKNATGPMKDLGSAGWAHKYGKEEGALPGVPVRTVTLTSHGKSVDEIGSVERKKAEPGLFEVPSGLRKEALPTP